ncbi:hypothetical protein B0H14DRAFT_3170868 [Mycena olivaceomarginata]|nr:hypothetical protein B0H14DRAFT_3170868 [Mycena olivaceomarginata]
MLQKQSGFSLSSGPVLKASPATGSLTAVQQQIQASDKGRGVSSRHRSVGVVCTSVDISTITTSDKGHPPSCLCGCLGRRVFGSVGVVCTSATYPPVLHQTNALRSRNASASSALVSTYPPSTPPDKTLGRPRAACAVVQAVASLNASASSAPVSTYPSILLQIKECSARMHSSCLCGLLGRLVTARVGVVCTGVDIPPSTLPDQTLGHPSAACMVGEAFVFPNASASSATVSTYTLSLYETKH